MQIIVRRKESEAVRRFEEGRAATRRHYYGREIRDGSRFKSKAGTKEAIKKVLE